MFARSVRVIAPVPVLFANPVKADAPFVPSLESAARNTYQSPTTRSPPPVKVRTMPPAAGLLLSAINVIVAATERDSLYVIVNSVFDPKSTVNVSVAFSVRAEP